MSSFTPSVYQEDIFAWGRKARPGMNLVVNAVAGSGKSKTIELMSYLIPSTDSALFLAFNKHIAVELASRLPANVMCSTLNSFGWQICRQNIKGVQLQQYKTFNLIDSLIPDEQKRKAWKDPLSRLIALKKASPSLQADEIIKRFDLEAPTDPEFMDASKTIWCASNKQTGIMDYDDQVFMPMAKKWTLPKYQWLFVDECQDLSEVQIDMIRQIGERIICVGDPFQAIYQFRGAAYDSVDRIIAALNPTILPLSISYRCPKAVIAAAQEIVPHIQAASTAKDGLVERIETKVFLSQAAPGDWALCRTTAPLVKRCLQFISAGKKASVKGRDIGKNIVALIDKINQFGDLCPLTQFGPMLQAYQAAESARLEAAGRDGQLESLEDKVNCIEVLSEGSLTVKDIKDKIFRIFSDEQSPGVTFATGHRAKGLEAKHIFILRPDLVPFPKAKSQAAIKQEYNLKYVMITRAMETLSWVIPEPDEVKRARNKTV